MWNLSRLFPVSFLDFIKIESVETLILVQKLWTITVDRRIYRPISYLDPENSDIQWCYRASIFIVMDAFINWIQKVIRNVHTVRLIKKLMKCRNLGLDFWQVVTSSLIRWSHFGDFFLDVVAPASVTNIDFLTISEVLWKTNTHLDGNMFKGNTNSWPKATRKRIPT